MQGSPFLLLLFHKRDWLRQGETCCFAFPGPDWGRAPLPSCPVLSCPAPPTAQPGAIRQTLGGELGHHDLLSFRLAETQHRRGSWWGPAQTRGGGKRSFLGLPTCFPPGKGPQFCGTRIPPWEVGCLPIFYRQDDKRSVSVRTFGPRCCGSANWLAFQAATALVVDLPSFGGGGA